MTSRNKSIQNLRPPPKPENTTRPYLTHKSNRSVTRRNSVDAIDNVEGEEVESENLAALNKT